jgi:inosine/xanthosine triphosphatase
MTSSSDRKSISVGTKNPAKIKAVKDGFSRVWPEFAWEITGIDVSSGVSAQPMTDEETIQGALNRAYRSIEKQPASYGVGVEGGLHLIGNFWFDCGWIVVVDQFGQEGIGSTARIITPSSMIEKIKAGQELGYVVDEFFGTKNAKQGDGHFGLMTNGAITRTSGYADGVVMALARFLHPHLF